MLQAGWLRCGIKAMCYPHLLSSSTLLSDSIHSGSTSPSHTTHDCVSGGAAATCGKL